MPWADQKGACFSAELACVNGKIGEILLKLQMLPMVRLQ